MVMSRGYDPKDAAAFDPKAQEKLNFADQELRFLLNRGYGARYVCQQHT